MLASQIPAKVPLPFANNGTKNAIPIASQIGVTPGAASLADGFPPLTFTPLAAGGVPPAGADFNGILNLITAVQQWQSAGGSFKYDAEFSTSIGGYPKGSILIGTSNDVNWISLADNNATDPDSGTAANWGALDAFGIAAVTGLSNANVTLTPAQHSKRIITLAGVLTANVQIIFPTSPQQWTVANNTTGAFTVTCKTAAGTGLEITQGSNRDFYCDGINLVGISVSPVDLAATTGAAMVGWDATTLAYQLTNRIKRVVNSVAALKVLDKTKYTQAFVTGYYADGDGGGGAYYYDAADITTPDNGGTVIVASDGGRWKLASALQFATVHTFGAKGDGVTNDRAPIQACTTWAMGWNGVVRFLGLNYKLTTGIVVADNSFRSVKFEGVGTGNAQTASSGGTCLVVTGNVIPITAAFNVFANENIIIDGVNFYNTTLDQLTNGPAVKIIRGAANSRYLCGLLFRNVGIHGFGAGFAFQGMNTVNADNNFIGSTVFDNVSITVTGIGFLLSNCSLNLVTLSNTVLLDCKYGGIRCERDGDVGPGNGKGSAFIGTLCNKTHFEGVGGMFRTCATEVLNSLGEVTRSVITLIDFTHENCGESTLPVSGESFQLGVNTDIHVVGNVVPGLSYGEVLLPYLNSTARLWCDSTMRVIANGGRIMTPRNVNAPVLRRIVADGDSTVITVPLAESTEYAIRSTLILAKGQGGIVESLHTGVYGSSPTRTQIAASALGAGLTLTWGAVAGADAIQLTVANASGFTYTAELQIENLSSASITMASEV